MKGRLITLRNGYSYYDKSQREPIRNRAKRCYSCGIWCELDDMHADVHCWPCWVQHTHTDRKFLEKVG